jgi:hypothetical protein
MTMNRVFTIVFLGACTLVCNQLSTDNQEFVMQPRSGRRVRAVRALHQEICDAIADLMKAFPDLLRGIADVQALSIECIDDAVQGEKNGVLATMNKEELEVLQQTLTTCITGVRDISKKLNGVARRSRVR